MLYEVITSSIQNTTSKKPVLLPNLGGSIPNDVFACTLGLPTLWVPHSYPACSQHAPNEHVLPEVMFEGLMMMTGLFWDLAEEGTSIMAQRKDLLAAKDCRITSYNVCYTKLLRRLGVLIQ